MPSHSTGSRKRSLSLTNDCNVQFNNKKRMIPAELISAISKLTSQQVEQVTCIECCKYYIAPETAACGHTLCHGCWTGRRSCPLCASSLDRRALRLNIPMQMLTEHIHGLGDAFETLFNIKLDDFLLDMPDEIPSNTDPTKNVKEWLASSQNEFSAPVTALSSQLSTQDLGHPVEVSKSKIQLHTHTKKSTSSPKVISAPPCQEDWDKIEVLPDTEDINIKNKENIVNPMDLEPFCFYEYTTENPRRSSRKRDYKNESNPNLQVRETSADKHSSKNSSTEAEKKSTKVKQNWSNVKKMRKEFSKLNKINRSKLNVSIEMCKKAQNTNKPKEQPLAVSQQAGYVIDDNTPDVMNSDKEKVSIEKLSDGSFRTDTKPNEKHASNTITSKINENGDEPDKLTNNSSKSQDKEKSDDIIISNNDNNHKECAENIEDNASLGVKNKPLLVDQSTLKNCLKVSGQKTEKKSCMPFIKKSALRQNTTEDSRIQIVQNEIESNANTDDIEISIKIGNTITNIFIKKKQDDVQLKVNTDREIQTSLGPYNLPNQQDAACSPFKEVNVVNLQLNIDGNKAQKVTSVSKTVSTKINTDSADTATANFEITDSVEKEISDVMDCIEIDNAVNKPVKNLAQVSKTSSITKSQTKDIKITNINEIEDLNDMDIFESDSVKEANVQLLKNTEHAPSEIIPTMKSKKSQRVPDKRDRDVNEEIEMPSNKKQKMYTDKSQTILHETDNENNMDIANDSESMSYDKIMGQVFENIDAEIKSQNTVKNTQKNNKPSNTTIQSQCSQIIHKTQKTKSMLTQKRIPPPTLNTQEHINQKFSENIFSMVEKDNESHSEMRKDNSQLPEAESVVEVGDNTEAEVEGLEMEHILGTPVVENDDSDKSVVEETPQKNMSFTKLKSKQDVTKQNVKDTDKPQLRSNSENPPAELKKQPSDSQIIKSIINISDASEENTKTKDTTVVEITRKISVLETPLTINKFVNHIKHNSTPVARKSLNFDSDNIEDPEQTLCPTTTQEKEFLTKAFEQTPNSPIKRPLGLKNSISKEKQKLCIAGSCLTSNELINVKLLCHQRGWTYVDKYIKDLTHLVVGVDEENKSQRSVKYMCALAASKWIVSYNWVEKCLKIKQVVDELPYEALDACGDPGPRQSRIAQRKLFEGIKFYCMPPFSVLDVGTLKYILEAAGGCVVEDAQGVRVADGGAPALLLAEPEHTQEDRFMYLAMELSIVPVNYEWVLNCLGTYSLGSLHELLLCPSSLLHPATGQWPASLLMRESNDEL